MDVTMLGNTVEHWKEAAHAIIHVVRLIPGITRKSLTGQLPRIPVDMLSATLNDLVRDDIILCRAPSCTLWLKSSLIIPSEKIDLRIGDCRYRDSCTHYHRFGKEEFRHIIHTLIPCTRCRRIGAMDYAGGKSLTR